MRSMFASTTIAALALCATGSNAQPADAPSFDLCSAAAGQDQSSTQEPVGSMEATPRDAATYVAKAGASDMYEIQSSRLAEEKASSDAVKQFGRMMIDHHTKTTQDVTAAARSARMTPPPPALEPRQQAMLSELQGLSGAAFDTVYVRQQRMAHDQALALHSGYAGNGDTPALRNVAKTAVPLIRRHIEQLRALPSR